MLSVPSSPFPFECLVCLSWSTLPDLGDEIAAEIGHVCLIILCCNINSNIRSIILYDMIMFSNSCLHPWLITIRDLIVGIYRFLYFIIKIDIYLRLHMIPWYTQTNLTNIPSWRGNLKNKAPTGKPVIATTTSIMWIKQQRDVLQNILNTIITKHRRDAI